MNAAVRAPRDFRLPQDKQGFFARLTWKATLFYFTVGAMLAWSLSMGVLGGTELDFSPIIIMLRVATIMVALRVIFISRFTLLFTIAVLAVAAIILGIGALSYVTHTPVPYQPPREWPALFNIGDFLGRVINYITGATLHQPAYDAFIQWAVALLFSVFVFTLGFVWLNFFAVLVVSMVTFALMLNSGFFNYAPAFYAFIFCVVAYLIRHLNQRSMNQSAGSTSPFVLYALPITAVCLIFALALPTPREGTARNLADNLITRPFVAVNNFIQDMFHPRHFSLAQTGFGMGDRRLGGNVVANYERVMRINHQGQGQGQGSVYLTGNILDAYTGYSWTNTLPGDDYVLDFSAARHNLAYLEMATSSLTMAAEEISFELMNMLNNPYLMLLFEGDDFEFDFADFLAMPEIRRNTLVVEHIFRGYNIFTTGVVVGIEPPANGIELIRSANGTTLADRLLRREARYTITYAHFAPGHLRNATLSASHPGIFVDSYNIMRELESIGFNMNNLYIAVNDVQIHYFDLLLNYLIPQAAWIQETYTHLPPRLPNRVNEMAQMVVNSAEATTHFEMATALESFLRTSPAFDYSLTPGPTPEYRDFVDHFLFDLQIGYCTHFASSFVIMARTLGIPARYVEGFIVTGAPDEYGYLDVINRQGHAWAEVYFEGFGWQLFEPTPPEAIFSWGYAAAPLAPVTPLQLDALEDFMAIHGGRSAYGDEFLYEDIDNIFDDLYGLQVIHDAPTAAAEVGGILLLAVYIVLGLLGAFIVGRVVYIGTIDTRIARKSNNEAVITNFHRLLRYLKLFDFEIQSHETATQLAERVGKRMYFEDNKVSMTDLADVFCRASYSVGSITAEDRQLLERAVQTLDKRLWAYMGMRRYLMYKYVMAVI